MLELYTLLQYDSPLINKGQLCNLRRRYEKLFSSADASMILRYGLIVLALLTSSMKSVSKSRNETQSLGPPESPQLHWDG